MSGIVGTLLFVAIVLALSMIVMVARAILLPSNAVTVTVNAHQQLAANTGDKLLGVLNNGGVPVPAACGGKGSCGQCRVTLVQGAGEALPTETARLSRREIRQGMRLACQVVLRGDLSVTVPNDILDAESWDCTVVSSRTVAPLIRELVLERPSSTEMVLRAGAFVQVTAPAYRRAFAEFDIALEHQAAWDRLNLQDMLSQSGKQVSRAYSIANTQAEGKQRIVLLVRLALPPPSVAGAPPGVVSSYLFGLRKGDSVSVSGPFGEFGARDSNREMILIGGGVGMAPLRAIVADQLERVGTKRRISFWYGARSRVDLFYRQEFDRLQAVHDNFTWTVALSDPAPEDKWDGATGFIHDVVLDHYLKDHPAPEDCEYYLCGPPLMIKAVLAMLDDSGVEPDRIFNDDFGS